MADRADYDTHRCPILPRAIYRVRRFYADIGYWYDRAAFGKEYADKHRDIGPGATRGADE